MKSRRSRWILAATVAIALCTSLMSLPSLTPLAFSSIAPPAAYSVGAPPAGASWQVAMTSNRW
ncbi:hypothetical protein [Polaromonas glacialis]|uniref:hypothetical protein n=1 Tax=Polaromonas glacialis TaxID=866564 RepID=UPI0012EC5A9C|nr:hypothetical protein [Polaromonas glacialis]